jgi:hypothetical protein
MHSMRVFLHYFRFITVIRSARSRFHYKNESITSRLLSQMEKSGAMISLLRNFRTTVWQQLFPFQLWTLCVSQRGQLKLRALPHRIAYIIADHE